MLRRITFAATLSLVLLLVFALPASASRGWCYRDPIVRLNGSDVQIWIAIPAEYQSLVSGPVEVTVSTPSGVTRTIEFTDEGFNGFGEVAIFADVPGSVNASGRFRAQIEVRVPIDTSLIDDDPRLRAKGIPVQMVVNDIDGTQTVAGTSNRTSLTISVVAVTGNDTDGPATGTSAANSPDQ